MTGRHLLVTAQLLAFAAQVPGQTVFTDVTDEAGVGDIGSSPGCAWGDYDNDGFLDLYETSSSGGALSENHLYRNQGDGTFVDVAEETGVRGVLSLSYAAGFADYDNDGDLDLFVAAIGPWNTLYNNQGDGSFADVTEAAGVVDSVLGNLGVAWADYDLDGWLDLYVTSAANGGQPAVNHLYRNIGDGTLVDMALALGVESPGFSESATWADYDNDGDPDLYVTNRPSFPLPSEDFLYRNEGDGTFTDVSEAAGLGDEGTGITGSWGDYDNDGHLDLYLARVLDDPDILYRNNADGTFTDVTIEAGLGLASAQVHGSWADYDNDGDLDIYVTDFKSGETNVLYRNNGDGTFTDVAADAGVAGSPSVRSSTACWGDYDGDGDLDLYVTNEPFYQNKLYRNEGNDNHFLVIKTVGTVSNRDGYGARVRISYPQGIQIREVGAGSGFTSMNSLPVEFGLGAEIIVDTLFIRWPSGLRDTVYALEADQFLTCTEGEGCVDTVTPVEEEEEVASGTTPQNFALHQNYPNPFNPVTTIKYALARSGEVALAIYNLRGEEVARLVEGEQAAGEYQVIWDASNVASGIYFYRLQAGEFVETRKMVLLR